MSPNQDAMMNRKGQQRRRLWERFRWFSKHDDADKEAEPDELGTNAAPAPPVTKSGRRVFGFPCSPDLSFTVRLLHKELALPIYPVAEHALGLGCAQIAQDISDEASRRALLAHLTHEHFLSPTLALNNQYDLGTAIRMRKAQLRCWELDRMAREIVEAVDKEGISPRFLLNLARQLIRDARQRRNPPGGR